MELTNQNKRDNFIASGSDYSKVYEDAGQSKAGEGAFRRYSRVIYLNVFFMIMEILGGSLARSFSVMSEGIMLFIDILTSGIRICGAYSLDKVENVDFNFGYGRVEPIAIVLETSLVWFCMVIMLIISYYMHMITTDDRPLRPGIMLLTSIITLVGDASRIVVVYGCGVLQHLIRYPWLSLQDRENIKIKKGNRDISIRRIMEAIKGGLIYDTLVFLFSILICFNSYFVILDKLSIFFLIAIIFYSTMPNFKRNLKILMEGNLRPRFIPEIKKQIGEIDTVFRIESIRIWVIEEGKFASNVHVSVEKDCSPYPVTRKIGAILEKYKIAYWTIQVWQNDGLSYPLFKDAYLES